MILLKDIYTVYSVLPGKDRKIGYRPVGKFWYNGQHCAVLQDLRGFLSDLPHDGVATPEVKRAIWRLMNSSTLRVRSVANQQKADGQRPEDSGPAAAESEPRAAVSRDEQELKERGPVTFHYQLSGMSKPVAMVFDSGVLTLNGKSLTPAETEQVLANLRTGKATLRYGPSEPSAPITSALEKAERLYVALSKADGPPKTAGLAAAFEHMRDLMQQGLMDKGHYETVRRHMYEDTMIPGMGNHKSLLEHKERAPHGGVYGYADLNGLKAANEALGHHGGDQLIRGAGEALRRAINVTVGSAVAKAWHPHGDELVFHAKTPEHAHQILRQWRSEMESVAPIGGTHKLSVSVGLGHTPDHADQAMAHAKTAKLQAIKDSGQNPENRTAAVPHHMYAHSLLTGSEGVVQTHRQPTPLSNMPKTTPSPVDMPPQPKTP